MNLIVEVSHFSRLCHSFYYHFRLKLSSKSYERKVRRTCDLLSDLREFQKGMRKERVKTRDKKGKRKEGVQEGKRIESLETRKPYYRY